MLEKLEKAILCCPKFYVLLQLSRVVFTLQIPPTPASQSNKCSEDADHHQCRLCQIAIELCAMSTNVLSHGHETVLRICLAIKLAVIKETRMCRATNHGLDIWMWHSVKFMEFELVIRTNVDISTLVFSTITILGCREDYKRLVKALRRTAKNIPVMHFPSCSSS